MVDKTHSGAAPKKPSPRKVKKNIVQEFLIIDPYGRYSKVSKNERDYRLNICRGWRKATDAEAKVHGS